MSGTQFYNLLQELGYSSKTKVRPESFDWMFITEEATKPLFSWICNNIKRNNLVTDEELKKFASLQAKEQVLDEEDLEDALQSINFFNEEETVDSLKEEIANMKKELEQNQQELTRLVHSRDRFTTQQSKLNQRLVDVQQLHKRLEDESIRTTGEKLKATNNQLNEAVGQISKSVANIVQLQGQYESGRKQITDQSITSLAVLSFHEYYQAEEEFSQMLINLQSKFSQNSMNIDDSNDKYSLLNVQDPMVLYIKGESAENHAEHSRELKRLQNAYMIGMKTEIKTAQELSRVKTGLEMMQYQAASAQKYQLYDTNTLNDKINETKKQYTSANRSLAELTQVVLPSLVTEVSKLQQTQILWGDYNLKIARQNYLNFKQSQILSHLLQQQARFKVVSMSLKTEMRRAVDMYCLLTAVATVLDKSANGFDQRLKWMSSYQSEGTAVDSRNHDKNSSWIDLKDQSLLDIYQLLRSDDSKSFASVEAIIEQARQVTEKFRSLDKRCAEMGRVRSEEIEQAREIQQRIRALLFGSASSSITQPNLTPKAITDAQQRLENALNGLGASMESIMKVQQDKQLKLQALPKEAQIERNLFYYFYVEPENLKKLMRDLERRVESRAIIASK
jgi:HAUS augmin-like complex subunit 3